MIRLEHARFPSRTHTKSSILGDPASLAEKCNGEFTWIWGTGRFKGISGTTPFQSGMEIGVTESGAIHDEATWPEFTYQLP